MIAPDPIRLNYNFTIAAAAFTRIDLDPTTASSAQLTIAKKVFGSYVEIPCVGNVGSCTYNNLCDMLGSVSGTLCPVFEPFGVPCKCPIESDAYRFGPFSFKLPDPRLPWLTNGDYRARAVLKQANGAPLGCIEAEVAILADD